MGMHCADGKDKTGPWSKHCREVETEQVENLQAESSKLAQVECNHDGSHSSFWPKFFLYSASFYDHAQHQVLEPALDHRVM